jgi:hypothetical protein
MSFYDIFLVAALVVLGVYVAIGYRKILIESKQDLSNPEVPASPETPVASEAPVVPVTSPEAPVVPEPELITDTTGSIEEVKTAKAKKPSIKKASKKAAKKNPRRRDL